MNPKYPHKKFTIRYNLETKTFCLFNNEDLFMGEDKNGRELARDAWDLGAEEVCYDYDLQLDEHILLTPCYSRYKKQ